MTFWQKIDNWLTGAKSGFVIKKDYKSGKTTVIAKGEKDGKKTDVKLLDIENLKDGQI